MRINFAHLRERSTTGGWIDFAVFDACPSSHTLQGKRAVLANLTARARRSGLKIDQSALAFSETGSVQFFGDRNLVAYLSRAGVPPWTHSIST